MSVQQCPQCELTFSYKTELEWHVREEHAPRAGASPTEDRATTTR